MSAGSRPPPRGCVEELPREEEAAGEPVGFLFLIRIAGEETQPAHLLDFFHGMARRR